MIFCAYVLLLQESFKGIICITKDNISALKMTMSLTGLFLRNRMSLKKPIALLVCFILFSEEKHHRALVFPLLLSYAQGCALRERRRVCWRGRCAATPAILGCSMYILLWALPERRRALAAGSAILGCSMYILLWASDPQAGRSPIGHSMPCGNTKKP